MPGAGRPRYQPSDKERATVKVMAGVGVKQADICAVLGISPHTLRRRFKAELATAEIEANAAVSQSLFSMATKGRSVAAAIWWEKTRQGRSDRLQISGDADKPLAVRFVLLGEPEAKDAAAWQDKHAPRPP